MVYKPRSTDQIYDYVRERLEGQVSKLTNFVETSFNYVWTRAFARRFRENELALLAVQFSGWIDTAGGPIEEDDLEQFDIDDVVSPDEVNEYMRDEDLDNLVEIVGVERSEGEFAEGTVEITTVSSSTTIPEGTSFGTQPDSASDFLEYTTDEEVSTDSGETTVEVDITADERGSEYNLTGPEVTYMPDPPTGVQSVVNTTDISGGVDPETNDELRDRAKNAIFNKSGGGTASGVKGYVRENTEDVNSVEVKEYPGGNDSTSSDYEGPGGPGDSSSTAPFADVIVEGGSDEEAEESIEESRPATIQHNLVRPIFVGIDISADVSGDNIDTGDVETSLTDFVSALDLGEDLNRDKVIQRIMNADTGIDGIDTLTIAIDSEEIEYDPDSSDHPLYKLRKGDHMTSDGITEVTGTLDDSSHTFEEDTDYDEGNVDGSDDDAIDWGLDGDTPDEDTTFEVTYETDDDIPIDEYEKTEASSINVQQV